MKKLIVLLKSCFLYKFTAIQREILNAMADGKNFDQIVEIYKWRFEWDCTDVQSELDKIFLELQTDNLIEIVEAVRKLLIWCSLSQLEQAVLKSLSMDEQPSVFQINLKKLGYWLPFEDVPKLIEKVLCETNHDIDYLKNIAAEFV